MDTSDATLFPLWNWRLENLPPLILHPALGPSLQEGHWGAGACPEKGSGHSFFLWGKGLEHKSDKKLKEPGEKGWPYHSTTPWQEAGARGDWPLLTGNKWKDKRTWPQAAPGEVQVGQQEEFLHRKGDQALEGAAHGGGGVPTLYLELCSSCQGRVWLVRLLPASRMGFELYWATGVPNSCLQGSI